MLLRAFDQKVSHSFKNWFVKQNRDRLLQNVADRHRLHVVDFPYRRCSATVQCL